MYGCKKTRIILISIIAANVGTVVFSSHGYYAIIID